MADVPLSMNQLEDITTEIARELLEKWAIEDRFTEEEMVNTAQLAVDDTVFIINKFMEAFNTHMLVESEKQKLIH